MAEVGGNGRASIGAVNATENKHAESERKNCEVSIEWKEHEWKEQSGLTTARLLSQDFSSDHETCTHWIYNLNLDHFHRRASTHGEEAEHNMLSRSIEQYSLSIASAFTGSLLLNRHSRPDGDVEMLQLSAHRVEPTRFGFPIPPRVSTSPALNLIVRVNESLKTAQVTSLGRASFFASHFPNPNHPR
jgi:hypothetical protein